MLTNLEGAAGGASLGVLELEDQVDGANRGGVERTIAAAADRWRKKEQGGKG